MVTTNRVWRLHEIGGPNVLKLEVLPVPEPKDDEVLVRVEAFGLNRSDLLWMGGLSYVPTPPARLGYEMCGVIERVGAKVSGFKPGDRVSNFVNFYIGDYGCFANYALLPGRSLLHTPSHLSSGQGAAYVMYFTSYLALREMADLRAYQTVVITAASSAAGMTAISIARKVGATVIAVTRSSAKREALLTAGAHHVVASQEENLTQRLMELTGGVGADIAFDCVSGPQVAHVIQGLKIGGHLMCYGVLDLTPVTLQWYQCFGRLPRIDFFTVPRYTGDYFLGLPAREDAVARAKQFITGGVSDGSLPVHIAKDFRGIEALPDALRFMESNQGGGKIVVTL